jgi:hypothetical protein
MNQRPDYRPDKLGVIFGYHGGDKLVLHECRAGALDQASLQYIKSKARARYQLAQIKLYEVGALAGLVVKEGSANAQEASADLCYPDGSPPAIRVEKIGNEIRYTSRLVPLPIVASD